MQGILLAAGYGRRFDPEGRHDKLLAPLADGRPVLWHSARALCLTLPASLAVVRPGQAERVRWLRMAGCEIVESVLAEQGMGAALAVAVGASRHAEGWVVALADMPWLPSEIVRHVARAIDDPTRVAAPLFEGRRGHPVGFGRAWGARLGALTGDGGARDLLRNAEVRLLECGDAGVVRDVDRVADLAADLGD